MSNPMLGALPSETESLTASGSTTSDTTTCLPPQSDVAEAASSTASFCPLPTPEFATPEIAATDLPAGDLAGAEVSAEVEVIPPTKFPAGDVDFNKPIVVYNRHDDSFDARVLTVINSPHPVVVAIDVEDKEELVKFDVDGVDEEGDYTAENLVTEDRTMHLVLLRDGREFELSLFNSEAEAIEQHGRSPDLHAIIPITVPAKAQVITVEPDVVLEENDDEFVEEEDHDLPPGEPVDGINTRFINSYRIKLGDTVSAFRRSAGFAQQSKVLRFREVPQNKQILIEPLDGKSAPYWAWNANIRGVINSD